MAVDSSISDHPSGLLPAQGPDMGSIAKLTEALAKAQGAIKGAVKDVDNPFFKSKYADLASCWEACREPLSKNGLAVIQTTSLAPGGGVLLRTILSHSSGEWIDSWYPVVPIKNDPQGFGSALTYARRYCLSAMVGIAPEDDDGNAATGHGATKDTSGPVRAPKVTPIRDTLEPPPAEQPKIKKWADEQFDFLAGAKNVDSLFKWEDDNAAAMERLMEKWPFQANRVKSIWKERVAQLSPANG
jgi:hypothetical protein